MQKARAGNWGHEEGLRRLKYIGRWVYNLRRHSFAWSKTQGVPLHAHRALNNGWTMEYKYWVHI